MSSAARRIVALLCTVQFIDVLGVTLLNVALPVIQRDLDTGDAQISMIAGMYAHCFGSFLVPAGRISDLVGQRRMLMAGLVLFLVSSVLGGMATSGHIVLAARALQGLAAAIAVPAALSLLQNTVPDGPQRNDALGYWTATGAIGGASGFAIGGIFTETLGWRSLFLLGVPLLLLVIVLIPRVIPAPQPLQRKARLPSVTSLVFLPSGIFLLINGITALQIEATTISTWLQMAVGLVLLGIAFRANASSARPLIPPAVLANSRLLLAVGVAATITFVTSGTGTLMSFWLQDVYGLRPLHAGLILMLMSAGVVVGARAGSGTMDRLSRRQVITIGLIGLAITGGAFVIGMEISSLWILGACLTVAGACLGWTSVATTSFGLSTVAEEVRGTASGVLSAAAPIGTAIGIALMMTVATMGESATNNASRGMQLGLSISILPLALAIMAVGRSRHRE